uniref:Uncharacterized protein n=1 Tax=Meloidogyne incognita TaxID=6306 RepID=A0A914N5W2_MELIC
METGSTTAKRDVFTFLIDLGAKINSSLEYPIGSRVYNTNNKQNLRPLINFRIRLKAESLTIGYSSIYCHRVLTQKDFPTGHICPYQLLVCLWQER